MELLKTEFVYELADDGVAAFSFTAVLYNAEDKLFVAKVPRRVYDTDLESIDLHALNGREVRKQHVYPRFDSLSFTKFVKSLSEHVHIKRPNLIMHVCEENEEDAQMWKETYEEAKVCEVLKNTFHPNIARYLGCEVKDGYIVGLCFQEYTETLRQRMDRCPSKVDKVSCIKSVRNGIQHLHSLGFCHNDVSPDNVMFDINDIPVIIDFDSCRANGVPLVSKAGTLGFCRTNAMVSEPENDIFALQKLEEYLSKRSVDE